MITSKIVPTILTKLFGENFIPIIKYSIFLTHHKIDVFKAGLRTCANISDLIRHDLGKFTPKQIRCYARQYFGTKQHFQKFESARSRHILTNPHHIEYFIERNIDISPRYARHMVADWLAIFKLKDKKWAFDNCDSDAFKNRCKTILQKNGSFDKLTGTSIENIFEAIELAFKNNQYNKQELLLNYLMKYTPQQYNKTIF